MLENMPQTGTLMSVNDYLSTSFRPDCEYVDGVIVERNMGEKDHSTLQMAISASLFNRRKEWGSHVFPEQRVQVKPRRFRVPDVCVVVGAEPQEQILTQPPLLCIEILSKDDRNE
jgi:Uma2 family endonuclease